MDEREGVLEQVYEEVPEEVEQDDWGPLTGFWKTFFKILGVLVLAFLAGMATAGWLWWIVVPLLALGPISALICWMRYTTQRQKAIEEKLDRLLAQLDMPAKEDGRE